MTICPTNTENDSDIDSDDATIPKTSSSHEDFATTDITRAGSIYVPLILGGSPKQLPEPCDLATPDA